MKNKAQTNRLTISQCLIVKNEEKNIGRALSWGKDIMMEQIVVDTGSTDRTVEIAKQMGASVYYYEWKNNFADAKNYALEKASGAWIAFLDADEYLSEEDAKKLPLFLEKAEEVGKECGKEYQILRCQMVNLNDAMKAFSVFKQDRFFVNDPNLRYSGAIHETLHRSDEKEIQCCDIGSNLTLYHTGYSDNAYKETKKAERNVNIMKELLKKSPEDYNMLGYLADSLASADRMEEALIYDRKVVEHRLDGVKIGRLVASYSRLLRDLVFRKKRENEAEINSLYKAALEVCEGFPDFDYYLGIWNISMRRWEEAAYYFSSAIEKGDQYKEDYVCFVTGNLPTVCYWIALSEHHLGHLQKTVSYSVLTLRQELYHENALKLLLITFLNAATKPEEAIGFLKKLYNFDFLKDKLFLIKGAKKAGFFKLADGLFDMLSEEEQKELNGEAKTLKRQELPISMKQDNSIDTLFTLLMEQVNGSTKEELLICMKEALKKMKETQEPNYDKLLSYLNTYQQYYGQLIPEAYNYQAFELRVNQLSDHMEEYLWLYQSLEDFRSKKTLLAILSNWLYLNTSLAVEIRENGPAYFDLDLIPENKGGVYVDIGAGTGNTIYSFVQNYGESYQSIHCYEGDWEQMERLKELARNLNRIEFHTEDIPSLDEEITETVTFIKIVSREALKEILEGGIKTIQNSRPRLAIDVSSRYDHLWSVAWFIEQQSSGYRYYLRHYGGNLIPGSYVLYAIPS